MILGTKNSNGIGLNDRWEADKGLGSKLAYFMKHVRDHTPKGNVKQWVCTLFYHPSIEFNPCECISWIRLKLLAFLSP